MIPPWLSADVPTILRQLPFFEHPTTLIMPGGPTVSIKRDQIVVWVSITPVGLPQLPPTAPRFPAILDTGFNGSIILAEKQLREWARLAPRDLRWISGLLVEREAIPLYDADVWLHPNQPHHLDPSPVWKPFRLELSDGVAVWPTTLPGARRLPLLGLRALRRNELQLWVDGRKGRVRLRTPWRFWPFG